MFHYRLVDKWNMYIFKNFTSSLKSAKTAHKKQDTIKILRTKFKSKKRNLNLKSENPTSTITSKNKGGPDFSNLDWIPLPTENRPEYIFILCNFAIFLSPAISRVFCTTSPSRLYVFPLRLTYVFHSDARDFSVGYLHTGA